MKYLIMAYRYESNDYFYPVGIFSSEKKAIEAAKFHRDYRGGKYSHKMFVVKSNKQYDAEECKGTWVTGSQVT